ncbi:hypothetical protein L6E12_02145 [Actinokineospora sp. PR83]|uniref:hypothetical protein n=1 Tax=Actinokineospora sp. PR83 TaxID=2884908 RepID=UPI001F4699EE|nr:hypothetical protein [Actinokineospora sp. PR83]MCG8914595.1 hypothetical protein [Actinokineospora sp. PR83]
MREDTTRVGTSTGDRATVGGALELGEIMLPPGAEMAGVSHDRGIDERYVLAIRLPAVDRRIRARPYAVRTRVAGRTPRTVGVTSGGQLVVAQ